MSGRIQGSHPYGTRRKLASGGTLILLALSAAACKPSTAPIERSQVRSGDAPAVVMTGSPLGQPSDSLREACSRSQRASECTRLPWSLALYNDVAALVDAAGLICSPLYVRSGQSATLRNQPGAAANPVLTIFAGTELSVASLGQQKIDFPQVRYRDSLGVSYGNTSSGDAPVFVDRRSVTCQLPQTGAPRTGSGTLATSPQERSAPPTASNQPPSVNPGPTAPLSPTAATAKQEATMSCMAIVPAHAKLLPWAKPMCSKEDGSKIELERGSKVVVGVRPEPGTPPSYWVLRDQCRIPAENLDLENCQPLSN